MINKKKLKNNPIYEFSNFYYEYIHIYFFLPFTLWLRVTTILIPSVYCIALRIIMRAQMSFSRLDSHRPLYTFCMNVQLFLPQKESTTPNSVKGVVSHRDQYPRVRYICQVKYKKQFVFKNNKQYICILNVKCALQKKVFISNYKMW